MNAPRSLLLIVALAALTLGTACGAHSHSRQLACDVPKLADTGPEWSPDGKTVVFRREIGRYVAIDSIPVSGGPAHRLVTPVATTFGFLSWSPDSKQVLFPALTRSGKAEVRAVGLTNGRVKTLGPGDTAGGRPVWSPDGTKIAFVYGVNGPRTIEVMNADGSGARRLTPPASDNSEPSWSPDGKRIAYVSIKGRHTVISVVDPNGAHRKTLVKLPKTIGTATLGDPAWSADGKYIGFAGSTGEFQSALFVVRTDGSGTIRRLAAAPGASGYDLAWSPRGELLAFVAFQRDANSPMYVLDLSSRHDKARRLDPDGFQPSWSPDGRSIVFAHAPGGAHASLLRIVNVAGGGSRTLSGSCTSS